MPEEADSGRIEQLERLAVRHLDPPTPERAGEVQIVRAFPLDIWMEVWIERIVEQPQ